jgi:hypothetical protein
MHSALLSRLGLKMVFQSRPPAGLAVSLHCPNVTLKLTSNQQPQTAQLIAELRGLQLAMPATGSAALTVQQLQVLLNSTQPSNSNSGSSSSGGDSAYVPVLQLPKLDDMRANLTNEASSSSASTSTSGSSSGQAAPTAAAGVGAAAQSPRPSALGRIYQDSLISAYISKLQVWMRD